MQGGLVQIDDVILVHYHGYKLLDKLLLLVADPPLVGLLQLKAVLWLAVADSEFEVVPSEAVHRELAEAESAPDEECPLLKSEMSLLSEDLGV